MIKATYQSNCTDSFDHDSGECLFPFFQDVSDFALADEEAMQLKANDFWAVVEHCKEIESLCKSHKKEYKLSERTGVYILYDCDDDIHYFFIRQK